jgi:hypothetical protein
MRAEAKQGAARRDQAHGLQHGQRAGEQDSDGQRAGKIAFHGRLREAGMRTVNCSAAETLSSRDR